MFANYNLIAAIASFIATIGKIWVENSHTLSHLLAEDLVLCLSILTEPRIIHYGMVVGVGASLGQVFYLCRYQAHPLKWAVTWGFKTSI
jgi:hypothetical protein